MKANQTRTKPIARPLFASLKTESHFAGVSCEGRGAIFTRREVVEFILDLAGYTIDQPLHKFRLLEPSFGNGDFLLPIVERLLTAYRTQVSDVATRVEDLSHALRAVEVNSDSIKETRSKLKTLLKAHGLPKESICYLLHDWLIEGDFLLIPLPHTFTHVVGNPPYVRQELVPDELMVEYRERYSTIYDRADLYIPFIERSLTSLVRGGVLGFICADRWMKNKYGGPLREFVAKQYHLQFYVDMVDTPAFHSDVIAYPAITIIKREKAAATRIAHRPQIDRGALARLAQAMRAETISPDSGVVEVAGVMADREPWILQSFDQLAVVRRLENDFPTLEKAGCAVGIGVATGADRVFIGPFKDLEVEPGQKLPLVRTKDIEGGTVEWKGFGVINPFNDDGSLADLKDHPKLARYLKKHAAIIRNRNCAKKNKKNWYRTIDRIYPALAYQPKLLIPDIKGEAHIVYEDGHFYPHHNLYYIVSEEWDLKALQVVLRSGIAKLFVFVYSTQMRGGYLRFQAQYLRRIRLPRWQDVPSKLRAGLVRLADENNIDEINRAVAALYRLSKAECAALGMGQE